VPRLREAPAAAGAPHRAPGGGSPEKHQPRERDDYIGTVVRQLEYLPPETVIERLTGDGGRDSLLAPLWSLDKRAVLGGVMKRQKQLDSIQGLRFQEG